MVMARQNIILCYPKDKILHGAFIALAGTMNTAGPSFSMRRAWLALCVLLCGVAGYWCSLVITHKAQLEYAEQQTRLRAQQMSKAFAQQIGSLVSGFEYLAHSLAIKLASNDPKAFALALRAAQEAFPADSLAQVAVADAQGIVRYSSLAQSGPGVPAGPPVSIADRAHFVAHLHAEAPHLYISRPVLGRVSGQWTIQFSYPIQREGVFDGVVVVSTRPEYLSRYFREIFTDHKNVALLARNDGSYLARSSLQDAVMDQQVKPGRAFITQPELRSGEYLDSAQVDGITRYYAWHRVEDYPLVVSVGLEREEALASTREAIQASRERSLLGTVAVLIAAGWIVMLFQRQQRNREALATSKARLTLALEAGGLGLWNWNVNTQECNFDSRWCQMLGLAQNAVRPHFDSIRELVHPDDWPRVQTAIEHHLSGETESFESEHRMRHSDGRWLWILARGRITQQGGDGRPVKLAGTHLDITDRRRAEQIRAELQQRLSNLASQVPGCVYQLRHHPDGRRTVPYASPSIQQLLHVDAGELAHDATHIWQAVYPDDLAMIEAEFQASASQLLPVGVEFRVRQPDGRIHWLAIHANPEQEADGATLWHGYIDDITERRLTQDALLATRTHLTEVIQHFPGGVLAEGADGRILVVNQHLCELLGIAESANHFISAQHAELCASIQELQRHQLLDIGDREALQQHECEVQLADGRMLRSMYIPVSMGEDVFGRLWIVQDVTERRQHEQMLERLATTDALTGLMNRRAFMANFEQELHRIDRGGEGGMLLMLDLDRFKRVNDTYGHAAGDLVLVELANILRTVLRRGDCPARLGGEEFAVLLPATSPEDALILAERLRTTLQGTCIDLGDQQLHITTSIGATPLHGLDPQVILARADAALYEAKRQGRNRVVRG